MWGKCKKSLIVVCLIILLTSCTILKNSTSNEVFYDSDRVVNYENYTWKNCESVNWNCEWNYVWWAAMNFAWTELEENIIKEKIELNSEDKNVRELVKKFNDPTVEKSNLDSGSYYIKSGYGQKTVKEINKESKKKFPNKSFSDLDLKLSDTDIISYAYFFKKVEYLFPFETDDYINFKWKNYKWFYADSEQKKNIQILNYESDDKFIIKLTLKDNSDELILVKWYDISQPTQAVLDLNKYNKENLEVLWSTEFIDNFKMPNLKLDYNRNYDLLRSKCLNNEKFMDYCIEEMYENIKFEMNEIWAKVENEAVMVMIETSAMIDFDPVIPKVRNFYLNDNFWVIMKKKDSKNPYFILGVNNDKLMESNK